MLDKISAEENSPYKPDDLFIYKNQYKSTSIWVCQGLMVMASGWGTEGWGLNPGTSGYLRFPCCPKIYKKWFPQPEFRPSVMIYFAKRSTQNNELTFDALSDRWSDMIQANRTFQQSKKSSTFNTSKIQIIHILKWNDVPHDVTWKVILKIDKCLTENTKCQKSFHLLPFCLYFLYLFYKTVPYEVV